MASQLCHTVLLSDSPIMLWRGRKRRLIISRPIGLSDMAQNLKGISFGMILRFPEIFSFLGRLCTVSPIRNRHVDQGSIRM